MNNEENHEVKRLLRELTNQTDGQLPWGVLTTIGNMTKLSRERVRQIAMKEGYINNREYTKEYYCIECGTSVGKKRIKFCSPECNTKYSYRKSYGTKQCIECGKSFIYLKSRARYQKFSYCSKKCQGTRLAREHGFRKGVSWKGNLIYTKEYVNNILPDEPFTLAEFFQRLDLNHVGYAYSLLHKLTLKGYVKKVQDGNRYKKALWQKI